MFDLYSVKVKHSQKTTRCSYRKRDKQNVLVWHVPTWKSGREQIIPRLVHYRARSDEQVFFGKDQLSQKL